MKQKTKKIAIIIAFCLVVSFGVFGIFALQSLNTTIGGNLDFEADGISFTVNSAAFYESNGTTPYTGITDQTGKMQGFSMDTDKKASAVTSETDTWKGLRLKLDDRGDALLKFNIENDMTDQDLYVLFEATLDDNATNMKITSKTWDCIPKNTNKDIVITFDILDIAYTAKVDAFRIKITLTEPVKADPTTGLVTNQTSTVLTNSKYTILSEANKTATVEASSEDIEGEVVIVDKVNIGGTDYAVTEVVEWGFCETNIEKVFIPSSVITISDGGFNFCNSLKEIEFSEGLQTIGDAAFADCYTFDGDIILPDSLVTLETSAFENLGNTVIEDGARINVTFGENLEYIGAACFDASAVYGDIVLKGKVKTICRSAFNNYAITSIYIPKSVTTIEDQAFGSGLETIEVESGNSVYKSTGNCLIHISSKRLMQACPSTIIPNDGSVTTIGIDAFEGDKFKYITLPSKITKLESDAINYCTNLVEIVVEATTPPTIVLGDHTPFRETNECPIYVPSAKVTTYKAANGWSVVSHRIVANV